MKLLLIPLTIMFMHDIATYSERAVCFDSTRTVSSVLKMTTPEHCKAVYSIKADLRESEGIESLSLKEHLFLVSSVKKDVNK